MKKTNKNDTINLFFSAFLILAFVVCAHFFSNFALGQSNTLANVIQLLVYAVFGLLLFYATRVGDGKPVKRFSPLTLIIMVLPALYIMVASLASGMPLHDNFVLGDSLSLVTTLAAVAFGYGIPYSFLSGYEIADDEVEAENKIVEGGLEADLQEADSESEEAEEIEQEDTETAESEENEQEDAEASEE